MQPKARTTAARAALLLVGAIWGSSLIVVKSSTASISPALLIALRFSMAFLLLSVVFFQKYRHISKGDVGCGAMIGLFLFLAYYVQTLGVTLAMPGKSAFLSSIYCVLVPFVYWLLGGSRPRGHEVLAAVLCSLGIVVCSVTESFTIVPGDLLALLSGLFYALHIAAIGKYGSGRDPILITLLQFGFCSAYAWMVSLFGGQAGSVGSLVFSEALPGVLYLGLVCSAAALLLQNLGQKYTDPSSASILMSTESVFGVIFSVIFLQEALNGKLIIGFALIFAAVLISQLNLAPIKRVACPLHAQRTSKLCKTER